MSNCVSVLLVMARQRRGILLELLKACSAEVLVASCCQEALHILQKRPPLQLVFTELSFADGSWWVLRQEMVREHVTADLIVCLPRVDGGVTDILEAGCSDVLVPPYAKQDIQQWIEVAAARRYARAQAGASH